MHRLESNNKLRLLILSIVMISIGISLPSIYGCKSSSTRVSPLVKSALDADWNAVLQQLDTSGDTNQSTEYRALRAHACLATNRNNESLTLFASLANDKDRTAWSKWTEVLVSQFSRNAIAHYLHGDALARQQQWDAALKELDTALDRQSDLSLAFIARGVVKAQQNRVSEGLKDFERAQSLSPSLADAHASLGSLIVQTRGRKSEASFDKALKAHQAAKKEQEEFALAVNGIGCANYGTANWPQAYTNFGKVIAGSNTVAASVAEANLAALLLDDLLIKAKIAELGNRPGTYIRASSQNLPNALRKDPTQASREFNRAYRDFSTTMAANPENADAVTRSILKEYGTNGLEAIHMWKQNTIDKSREEVAAANGIMNKIEYGKQGTLQGLSDAFKADKRALQAIAVGAGTVKNIPLAATSGGAAIAFDMASDYFGKKARNRSGGVRDFSQIGVATRFPGSFRSLSGGDRQEEKNVLQRKKCRTRRHVLPSWSAS